MLCKDIEHNLPAYLEDALSPREKGLIEEHLALCPHCKKTVEDLEKTAKLVREMEEVEPPPWFTQKIMSRVREEAQTKKGIFRKLFYPLHIKIPIQALTTVLIAVLAFQIYKFGEPEIKVMVAPPAAVFEAGKEHVPAAPQKSPDFTPAPSSKGKAFPKEGAKKERDLPASSPPDSSDTTLRRERMRIRHENEPSAQKSTIVEEEKETAPDRVDEAVQARPSAKMQEAPKALRAPAYEYKREESAYTAGAAREKRRYETAPTAPMVMGAVVGTPARISFMVHVKDASIAAENTKKLLKESGARKIQRQSRDGREVFTAEISGQKVREFMEQLKTIGETDKTGIPADMLERDVSITIELFSDR